MSFLLLPDELTRTAVVDFSAVWRTIFKAPSHLKNSLSITLFLMRHVNYDIEYIHDSTIF